MQQRIQPGDQIVVNFADLIHNRVSDRKGNVLPADLTYGTYDVKDLGSGHGSLSVGALVLDRMWGYRAAVPSPDCCGFGSPLLDLDSAYVDVGGFESIGATATDQCTGQPESIFDSITDWWSGNSAIAQVTKGKATGVSPGTTTANGSGEIVECSGNTEYFQEVAPSAPVTVYGTPDSETTALYGTYLITEGSFVMTLNPGTYTYDGHYVTESDYATGTDTCYWPGANLTNPPSVAGSTWTVGQNGSAHNQYGVDSIGFNSVGVSYIQQNAAEHDVDFPCVVTFYQEMDYEVDANTFLDYAENVDTQTIGSNTVTVCRAGVCTGTIPW